jgi:hypothetical protein
MVASNLTFDTHKVPAYLRGLVENRARSDGQIQRLTAMLEDLQKELKHAHAVRDSCDALLSSRFASLDRNVVNAIQGWRGRYGKRGAFASAMREMLQLTGPVGLSPNDLLDAMAGLFGVEFTDAGHRRRWGSNSVRNRLNAMKAAGLIEAVTDSPDYDEAHKRWRWKEQAPATPTLPSIHHLAALLGVEVEVNDEDHIDDPRNDAQDSQLPQGAG